MRQKEIYEKLERLKIQLNLPYIEAEDGTKLYYREFLSENPQKILLCIHGLGGHSGGYIELAERLKKLNIVSYAIDLRGHGLSQEKKQPYFSFSQIISDVKLMINFLKNKYPEIPLYLLGESMGGIIVLNVALEEKIDGLILLAAGIKTNVKLGFSQIIGLLLILFPSLIFKNLKLINMEANWDKANNNPEQIKLMKEDPLLLRRVSLAFLLSIAKYYRRIMKECINLKIPVLILQGTADELVSYRGAEEFYNKLKSENKEIKLFEGASHGLLADAKTGEVIKTIEEWFRKF
jgi:alpha-beta hydrolase superfamily lysophospholipase